MTTLIDSTPTSPVRLPGFTYQRIDVEGVLINCAIKGAGPPLLLPGSLAIELVESMLHSGAIVQDDQRIRAATDYARTEPGAMRVPFPKDWS
jgi:hypothetical protein